MKRSLYLALLCSVCLPIQSAQAKNDQWYFGFGGGTSILEPTPLRPTLGLDEKNSSSASIFIGRDFDRRSSGQLSFYDLGEASYINNQKVEFSAADASLLFRLYDSNDMRVTPSAVSLALYWRFAFGYMERDAKIILGSDPAVYFGAGAGAEMTFAKNFALRLEAIYLDRDAMATSLQLVTRFGGRANRRNMPLSTMSTVSTGSSANGDQDDDQDNVINREDQCADSTSGFPVLENGCPLLDGVLSGVNFVPGTATLASTAAAELDTLAEVLTEFPRAKMEVHAHSDNSGNVKEQAVLTRARLRTLGMYLVSKGVRSNRLTLRSFGGSKPLYENNTVEGRAKNNRIELVEKL